MPSLFLCRNISPKLEGEVMEEYDRGNIELDKTTNP